MSKTEEIKVFFEALPAFSQQVLLDDLLQDFELQGKVLDLAYQEISTERSKKPCPYCKSEKVLKRGKQKGVQMYECKSCVIAKDHVSKTDKRVHVQTVNHTHRELKDFLRQFNGVSSKYLQNYLNLFAYADKLRESKHTIKQWLIGALLADNAYNRYLLFQQNGVNIRI